MKKLLLIFALIASVSAALGGCAGCERLKEDGDPVPYACCLYCDVCD